MGPKKGKKKKFSKQTSKSLKTKVFQFPFLENSKTIDSMKKQFYVIFIMRGAPGSGKSTLVKEIIKVYPNAVICSADHYFIENNQYIWSPERRYYAHQYSMKLATKCCEMNCPVVVIDNTNITENEAKAYFQIALNHSYITVLVSPQTPWRFDPVQLEKHGKHNVSLKALKIKVKLFEDIIPEFYAWFIGQQDAKLLTTLAVHHFKQCLKHFPQLRDEILKVHLEEKKPHHEQKDCELENHFDNTLKESLFCLAKNCLKGKVPGSTDFHSQDDVQSSCGKVFVLQVSKILVTPHFLISYVELTSEQMKLYGELKSKECKETSQEDLYKVVGKCKQKRQEKNDMLSTSIGYTDDEELHQTCLEKVEAKLSSMLSKIKPYVGIETFHTNLVAQSHPEQCHSTNMSTIEEKEIEEEIEEENIEQKSVNKNFTDPQVMVASGTTDEAFRMENKQDDKNVGNVEPEINNSLSKEELAIVLLTHHNNDNQTYCLENLKKLIKMKKSKDCKTSETIAIADSEIVHLQNGICIVHLKEKFKIEAIFSGQY